MRTVRVQEAKTHLSALLVEVEQGATINIARGRQTVARLVPVGTGERELGFGGYHLLDTFFDELPEAELSAWEGRARAGEPLFRVRHGLPVNHK